jgi:hypothetical protein
MRPRVGRRVRLGPRRKQLDLQQTEFAESGLSGVRYKAGPPGRVTASQCEPNASRREVTFRACICRLHQLERFAYRIFQELG